MRLIARCPVCHALADFRPAIVGQTVTELDGKLVRRRLYRLSVTCSLFGREHWSEVVGSQDLLAPEMRSLMKRARAAVRELFRPADFTLPEDAEVHLPSWYEEAVAVEATEGDSLEFTDADWERLRETVEKDVLPFHVERTEAEFMPAGSIVILRTGDLGVTTGGFRRQDAEAIDFSRPVGSELLEPKDVELNEDDEVASTLEALTYEGRHDDIYVGGFGVEYRFADPLGVRLLSPRGFMRRSATRFGLEDVAWILESDNDEHMRAFLALVSLYLEGDPIVQKLVKILAQMPVWAIVKEVTNPMPRIISAHVEDGRVVLCYDDGTIAIQPLGSDPADAPAPQPEPEHAQTELPWNEPAALTPQKTASAPVNQASTKPSGPHAVVTIGNQVVRWAPFRPIMRPGGKGFSVDPKDQNVRALAELCRSLREKGQPAQLHYILEGVRA